MAPASLQRLRTISFLALSFPPISALVFYMASPSRAYYLFFTALLPLSLLLLAPAGPGWAASVNPGTPSLEFIQNKGQWDHRVRYVRPCRPAGFSCRTMR